MQKKVSASENLMERIRKAESLAGKQRRLPASFADILTVIMQRMEISNSFSEKVYIKSAASVHREDSFTNSKLLKTWAE